MKLYISIFLLLFFVIFLNLATANKPIAPEQITGSVLVNGKQTVNLILNEPELVIFDSRKEQEFAKGHIRGSISLLDTKMTEDDLLFQVPSKTTPVLFYCNGDHCLRSARSVSKAVFWGYKNIYWYRKGWFDWLEQGFPISY